MRVGVIGICYKSSDLQLREMMAKVCARCFAWQNPDFSFINAVLLSTCNRIEIYFSAQDLTQCHGDILSILRENISEPFEHLLYSYFGEDCFAHLAFVTSGLDSVVLGETEIQGQVKRAYEIACEWKKLPSEIHFLFQKSLKIGKLIRAHVNFTGSQVTLETAILDITQMLFKDLSQLSVLFIGNSEINRKMILFFKHKKIHGLNLSTRSLLSARDFAAKHNVFLRDRTDEADWQHYDVVVCGAKRQNYVISSKQLHSGELVKNRIVFDLGLPRNVDPNLAKHPEIVLLNIDQLGSLISRKQSSHLKEFASWKELARASVKRQIDLYELKTSHLLIA